MGMSSDANEPLTAQQPKEASPLIVGITLGATAMGCGILTLPVSLKESGLVLGTGLLVSFQLLSDVTMRMLFAASQRAKVSSFDELCSVTLGRTGTLVSAWAMLLLLLTAQVALLILVAQLVQTLFARWGLSSLAQPEYFPAVVAASVAVVFPLTCLESLTFLRHSSTCAIAALIFTVFVVVYRFCADHTVASDLTEVDFGRMPHSVSLQYLSFFCHCNLLPIVAELPERHHKSVPKTITVTFCCISAIYVSFAVLGYLRLGNSVTSNLFLSHAFTGDSLGIAACVAVSITNMLKFPTLSQPTRDCVVALGMPKPQNRFQVVGLMALVNGAVVGLAVALKTLPAAFDVLGATSGALITFVLPGVFYARTHPESPAKRAAGYVCVALGVLVSGLCFYALAT